MFSLARERKALVDRVWRRGPPAPPPAAAAKLDERVSRLLVVLMASQALYLFSGELWWTVLFCFLTPLAVVFVVYPLVRAVTGGGWRQRRRLRAPRPAALQLRGRAGLLGRVVGDCTLQSPCTDTPCVAFGVRFVKRGFRARHVMLCDAVTAGFELHLDDGRRLHTPPSRIVALGNFAKVASPNPPSVRAYLAAVDPARDRDEPHGPYPYDEIHELVIRPGDRVEFLGDVETVPDAAAPATSYREAATAVLVPRGVPTFRTVEAQPSK